jgi:hypothetical protein
VKKDLAEKEGGLLNFAKGYEKFGLLKVEGGISYREWAPGARALYLTGDFSNHYPPPYIHHSLHPSITCTNMYISRAVTTLPIHPAPRTSSNQRQSSPSDTRHPTFNSFDIHSTRHPLNHSSTHHSSLIIHHPSFFKIYFLLVLCPFFSFFLFFFSFFLLFFYLFLFVCCFCWFLFLVFWFWFLFLFLFFCFFVCFFFFFLFFCLFCFFFCFFVCFVFLFVLFFVFVFVLIVIIKIIGARIVIHVYESNTAYGLSF